MERIKKIFMVMSLVFIVLCFGASVWLYSVLKDSTSMVIMAVLFVAMIWYALNVRSIFKKEE